MKITDTEVFGFKRAIYGMRNPMNSWDKSDSGICKSDSDYVDYTNHILKN